MVVRYYVHDFFSHSFSKSEKKARSYLDKPSSLTENVYPTTVREAEILDCGIEFSVKAILVLASRRVFTSERRCKHVELGVHFNG